MAERVTKAAEIALAAQHYVSCVEVMEGIGWLYPGAAQRWQQGQMDCLEDAVRSSPARISEAMELLRSWAIGKGLSASETPYVSRTPARRELRFSRSGDPEIERIYRTRWVSSVLSGKQRERLVEKASRAPELLVSNH